MGGWEDKKMGRCSELVRHWALYKNTLTHTGLGQLEVGGNQRKPTQTQGELHERQNLSSWSTGNDGLPG